MRKTFTTALIVLFWVLAPVVALAQAGPSIAELQAAVEADPDNGADWYALGRALQADDQLDAAIESFEKAIEAGFQAGGGHLRIAQIQASRGNTEEALRRLDLAAGVSPMVISFLPQIGGIPELAGHPRIEKLLAEAELARHPCREREQSRQFDFWIGEWTVTNPQGQTAGENVITRDLDGCVIRESWAGAYGDRGTSVNFYDTASSKWHQIWTSDNGTITHYIGNWEDGAMRFEGGGDFGDVDGETRFRRMTFTPNPDGSVRQLIEDSVDSETWTVGFDGTYRLKSE